MGNVGPLGQVWGPKDTSKAFQTVQLPQGLVDEMKSIQQAMWDFFNFANRSSDTNEISKKFGELSAKIRELSQRIPSDYPDKNSMNAKADLDQIMTLIDKGSYPLDSKGQQFFDKANAIQITSASINFMDKVINQKSYPKGDETFNSMLKDLINELSKWTKDPENCKNITDADADRWLQMIMDLRSKYGSEEPLGSNVVDMYSIVTVLVKQIHTDNTNNQQDNPISYTNRYFNIDAALHFLEKLQS